MALVAVTTAAAPLIAAAFARTDSKLEFGAPQVNALGGLTQFVANDGDRPAVVTEIEVVLPYPDGARRGLTFLAKNVERQHYIKAKSSELMAFEMDAKDLNAVRSLSGGIYGDDCTTTSVGTNFQGTRVADVSNWSCADLVTRLKAATPAAHPNPPEASAGPRPAP